MLELLQKVANDLPRLMADASAWQTVDVNYSSPRVERVWRDIGGNARVCLHRIHHCGDHEALWHPHPWPSAMKVVIGQQEVKLGCPVYPDHAYPDHVVSTVLVGEGSYYEMVNPHSWHSVRPLSRVSYSIMVTGGLYRPVRYDHSRFGQGEELPELSDSAKREIMLKFLVAGR